MGDLVNSDARVQATPFQSSAPEFDYWGSTHRQAAERLQQICKKSTLLTLFVGPRGSGKSTVARRIVWNSQEESLIGGVPHSVVLSADPSRAILAAFGAESGSNRKDSCYKDLSDYLRRKAVQFGLPTLIVDDAHQLSDAKQQALFDLAGFDLKEGPLFKIVLVGQTGLFDQIGAPQKVSLGSPIRLEPMTKEDTSGYVQHRFAAAGSETMPFTDTALEAIHDIADGNPVRINLLCMCALDEAEMQWLDVIDEDVVRECYNPTRMALDLIKVTGVRLSPVQISTPSGSLPGSSAASQPLELPVKNDTENMPKLTVPETETASEPKEYKPSKVVPLVSAAPPLQPAARFKRVPRHNIKPVATVAGTGSLKPKRRRISLRTTVTVTGIAAAVVGIAWITLAPDGSTNRSAPIEARVKKEALHPSDMVVRASDDVLDQQILQSAPGNGPLDPGIVQQASITDLSLPLSRTAPVASVAVDIDAATRLAQIRSVVGILPDSSNDRFRGAIAVAVQKPLAAVAAYALAAYDGHTRAAYYLAQMYELGEGIPVDLVLARSWYKRAKEDIDGASKRLEALPKSGPVTPIFPPVSLYSGKTKTGEIELVWTSAEGGDPIAYSVELADLSGRILHRESNLETSALRTELPDSAVYWRVEALASESNETAVSGWLPLGLNEPDLPTGTLADLTAASR